MLLRTGVTGQRLARAAAAAATATATSAPHQLPPRRGSSGAGQLPGAGDIDFLDPGPVQRAKSRLELARALAVLHCCSVDLFVSNALLWMRIGRRLLGQRGFNALMRASFFGQFVGGETESELRRTAEAQMRQGIMPMVAVPMEEPIGRLDEAELARLYEGNADKLIRAVELSAELNTNRPKMQLKLTAVMPTELLRALADGCRGPPEAATASVSALADLLSSPDRSAAPIAGPLSEAERRCPGQLGPALDRVRRVFESASRNSVQVLIDAEYSHINAGLSAFYLALATLHNAGERCLVYNTHQCYLRDSLEAYTGQADYLLGRGLRAGAKIVRGAYLDWENRQGAEINSGRSKVWSSHAETNTSYDAVASAALDRVAAATGRHEIILATHNTSSINLCLRGMRQRGLQLANNPVVSFGQLYGMADYISCPLSLAGCRVYKSIPYGGIDDTLPYLVRRASENRMIFGGVREERSVLRAALRAR